MLACCAPLLHHGLYSLSLIGDYWDYWDLGFGFFFLVFCMSGNGVVWAKFGLIEFSRCLSEGRADKIAVGSNSACSSLLWDAETCPVPSHALLLR